VPGHDGRYRFREYEPRDRKVLSILRAVAHDEPHTDAWGKPPASGVVHRTVVLCDEQERGRVIGAARVIAQDATRIAHLQFVCVEDGKRGLGLGTALVRWTEVTGKESFSARKVELEVDRSNEKARRLYERMGYALEIDSSVAARAWSANPTMRRMLGPPRVLRLVKDLMKSDASQAAA
jgi:ribosomal protein S18 acetylase RimI-like enzyme